MRSVFLPDGFAARSRAAAGTSARRALVLAVWLVVGLVAARLTFRWVRKDA